VQYEKKYHMFCSSVNVLGRAADQAYLIVGKLNTQYSPEEKIKEVHPNLLIGVETNYVGFEKKKDEKIEEPIVVILYFPSTSHFSVHLFKHMMIWSNCTTMQRRI